MKETRGAVATGLVVVFLAVGFGCEGVGRTPFQGATGVECTPGERICGVTEFSGVPSVLECIIVEGETPHKVWSAVEQCGKEQYCSDDDYPPVCKDCSCTWNECGDDECGNSCGECPLGGACKGGQCLPCEGPGCPPDHVCLVGEFADCIVATGAPGLRQCIDGC